MIVAALMKKQFAKKPSRQFSLSWEDKFWPPDAWYSLPENAVQKVGQAWRWDHPDRSKTITRKLTEEQLLLWAVNNIVGQICNGGFTQALYNSYGELAEEAILGLHKFGLTHYADLVDQAWDVFGIRPIPKSRDQRIERLERLSKMESATSSHHSMETFIEHYSGVQQGTGERFNTIESKFYALLHAEPHSEGYNSAYYRPLAEWIYEHRDRFFITAKQKPWYQIG